MKHLKQDIFQDYSAVDSISQSERSRDVFFFINWSWIDHSGGHMNDTDYTLIFYFFLGFSIHIFVLEAIVDNIDLN